MASDTRELGPTARRRLVTLIEGAGGYQEIAARMAMADGKRAPSKNEIEAQALRLARLVKGTVRLTMKSLNLISKALAKSPRELLDLLLDQTLSLPASVTEEPESDEIPGIEAREDNWKAPETDTSRIYRRLNKASELTARVQYGRYQTIAEMVVGAPPHRQLGASKTRTWVLSGLGMLTLPQSPVLAKVATIRTAIEGNQCALLLLRSSVAYA
jgi:hypothetical protein